jgi:hypothetical protein
LFAQLCRDDQIINLDVSTDCKISRRMSLGNLFDLQTGEFLIKSAMPFSVCCILIFHFIQHRSKKRCNRLRICVFAAKFRFNCWWLSLCVAVLMTLWMALCWWLRADVPLNVLIVLMHFYTTVFSSQSLQRIPVTAVAVSVSSHHSHRIAVITSLIRRITITSRRQCQLWSYLTVMSFTTVITSTVIASQSSDHSHCITVITSQSSHHSHCITVITYVWWIWDCDCVMWHWWPWCNAVL